MSIKTAVITGISGQDSTYLAELLLQKGYKVYGTLRRTATRDLSFLSKYGLQDVEILDGDLGDAHSINQIVRKVKPTEFYNLGAQSHVGVSFAQPELTLDITGSGVLRCLEAIKNESPATRFYQASTSELFGSNYSVDAEGNRYQDENTPFAPNSPYATAKLYAHNMVRLYRESYKLHASCGILMNHESERRSKDFVTRKITAWFGENLHKVQNGLSFETLKLGNLYAVRDWGYAKDYVEGMWLMLQQDKPDDYMLATGEGHSVEEFLMQVFRELKLEKNIVWDLVAPPFNRYYFVDRHDTTPIIEIDRNLYRPSEVPYLRGNYSKAKRVLGWEPKTSFQELVRIMVEHDVNTAIRTDHSEKIAAVN